MWMSIREERSSSTNFVGVGDIVEERGFVGESDFVEKLWAVDSVTQIDM